MWQCHQEETEEENAKKQFRFPEYEYEATQGNNDCDKCVVLSKGKKGVHNSWKVHKASRIEDCCKFDTRFSYYCKSLWSQVFLRIWDFCGGQGWKNFYHIESSLYKNVALIQSWLFAKWDCWSSYIFTLQVHTGYGQTVPQGFGRRSIDMFM